MVWWSGGGLVAVLLCWALGIAQVHADAESFFGSGQDSNDDGQVSEEEFVRQQSIRGAGIKEAYSCLDADANGQITRQVLLRPLLGPQHVLLHLCPCHIQRHLVLLAAGTDEGK